MRKKQQHFSQQHQFWTANSKTHQLIDLFVIFFVRSPPLDPRTFEHQSERTAVDRVASALQRHHQPKPTHRHRQKGGKAAATDTAVGGKRGDRHSARAATLQYERDSQIECSGLGELALNRQRSPPNVAHLLPSQTIR
ncbi:hypothetical protein WR25_04789 [Diploscapter pachys]|uniref:Uncharacterized protein n=1 Tax=Diploscapter pachys TaxID=2018661 RepID=A0A2A2LGW2_9BILA|nr:hypothetical protein WR25_04789 [Diploscapter pachys]